MRSLIQLLAVIAAFGSDAVVRAQDAAKVRDWPLYHIGAAIGLNENELSLSLSEAGGIPARIWGDSARSMDGGRAWKLVGGFRPLRVVGAEVQYLHFGDGVASLRSGGGGQVPQQGATIAASSGATVVVSALLFIPERAPAADFYAKVGIAKLDEVFHVYGYDSLAPGCQPACGFDIGVENSDSVPYVGFGVRMRAGRLAAVRIEYESIDRDVGNNKTMFSLGLALELGSPKHE